MIGIPCTVMRGGTSRGLFFLEADLPKDKAVRFKLISKAFGSPDPTGMQINGLGGTEANMNKLAIISRREGEPNTVNYEFGQIDIFSWTIDQKANCGNISSAVGAYAIENGLVDLIEEPITKVMVYNTNTKKYILEYVPVKDGKVNYEGDFMIAGVAAPGSKIRLDFLDPGGATTGKLLPTGSVTDIIKTDNYGEFEVSIVDAANPFVFIRAEDVGMMGTEMASEILARPAELKKMLEIRAATAVYLGDAKDIADAYENCKATPKFCYLASPKPYNSATEGYINTEDIDILARMLSMGRPGSIMALTGAICLGVASKIKGSIPQQLLSPQANASSDLRIGHPSGVLPVTVDVRSENGAYNAVSCGVYRTCRKLMTGTIYVL